jgi:hypothetical protein
MKKNKLLPIILVAGAGLAAYYYFKNKNAAKEITDGIDVAPLETEQKQDLNDQTSTTTEDNQPNENKVESYIKTGTSILNKAKQVIKARKKRRSTNVKPVITRKEKKLTRKAARTAKRATRKKNKVVTGFEF